MKPNVTENNIHCFKALIALCICPAPKFCAVSAVNAIANEPAGNIKNAFNLTTEP